MRRWAMIAVGLALAGCGPREGVEVTDAWVRLPAVPGRPAAAYFRIRAHARPAMLVGVESLAAGRAEMHQSMAGGGTMSMKPLTRVAIPADGVATFEPGGRHVMVYDVAAGVKAGGTMPLRLHFAGNATPASVEAKVVGAADPAP